MYFVYADGVSIYNPFDSTLTIHSPKVTLELGKAGSFQFDIPPTNQFYNQLTELKTVIRVELDNKTIFYGRVFSITRNFNNIKKVYCEGALSYLVDTLQQAESYKGKAAPLFRKIIEAHNKLADSDKKFTVDKVQIQDQDVVIPGKKDKDGNYYGDKYEQTIIESIAEEWLTTYDYINNVLIEYLGGYLMCDYDFPNDKLKISYISEDQFDSMISEAESRNLTVPSIDYGVNMLDLTEELNAEDLCTVLIPLGDDGLTIEKATNKDSHSDVKVVKIDDKYIGIAHKASVEKYGTIIKSYVFDNVNEANTLFTNGYKYLKAHKNIPLSFTVKAVDMHFVNPDQDTITLGEIAKIDSTPHGLTQYLICTKIEYDFEDASKNLYTFGNPRQSMTERYKKNKEKARSRASRSSAKSSGKALSTASEITQTYVDNAVQEINDNYATTKTWVEKHYAGIEDAVHFVSSNGEGFVRATSWVDRYGANAEEVLTWHGRYADSAVSTIKWANDNSAGIEETVSWKNANQQSLATTSKWVSDYGAEIKSTTEWAKENVSRFSEIRQWVNEYGAGVELMAENTAKIAKGIASTKLWVDDYAAQIKTNLQWSNGYVTGAYNNKVKIDKYAATAYTRLGWTNGYASGAYTKRVQIDGYAAAAKTRLDWTNGYATGAYTKKIQIDGYAATAKTRLDWTDGYAKGAYDKKVQIDSYAATAKTRLDWTNGYATGSYNNKIKIDQYAATAYTRLGWTNGYASGAYTAKQQIDQYAATALERMNWTNGYASGAYDRIVEINAYASTASTLMDWTNGYATGAYNQKIAIDGYASTISTNLEWSNEYVKTSYKNDVSIGKYASSAKTSMERVTDYTETVTKKYEYVTDYSAEIKNAVEFYSKYGKQIKSYAAIKQVADEAHAMAGLFATYNNNKASISVSASDAGALVDIIADKVDVSKVEMLVAKGLTADKIYAKAFNANSKFYIGTVGVATSYPMYIQSPGFLLADTIYLKTEGAGSKVLSSSEIKRLITGTSVISSNEHIVDKTYIIKELSNSNFNTLYDTLVNELQWKSYILGKDMQINTSDGPKAMKKYVEDIVKECVTASLIKNKLTEGKKTFSNYISDIVKKNLETSDIECKSLKVMYNDKSVNIIEHIRTKIVNHNHSIDLKGLSAGCGTTNGNLGLHYHTVKIGDVEYNTASKTAFPVNNAGQSSWYISVKGKTDKGTVTT